MAGERHKQDTKTFDDLSFSEQAKSISAQLLCLVSSVRAHVRKAKAQKARNSQQTLLKCVAQVARATDRMTRVG